MTVLLLGWALPSVLPPYVVMIINAGPSYPDWREGFVYCVEEGFFSKGLTIDEKWSESEVGHSFALGTWLPGSFLSLSVPLSAALLLFGRWSQRPLRIYWGFVRVLLLGFGVVTFYVVGRFPEMSLILICSYLVYAMAVVMCRRRLCRGELKSNVGAYMASVGIAFYPWWIITGCAVQRVVPFFGLAFTVAGCLLLLAGFVRGQGRTSAAMETAGKPTR
jgi:hypothetical protein